MHQRAQHSLTCVYVWLSTHWWHFKSLMLWKFGTFSGALKCLGLEACVTFQLFQPTSQALPGSWLSGWGPPSGQHSLPSFWAECFLALVTRVWRGKGTLGETRLFPSVLNDTGFPSLGPDTVELRASCMDLQSVSGEWMSRPVSLAKKQRCSDFCGVFLTLKIMIF